MADWLAPLRPYDAAAPYLHANRRLYERHGLSLLPDEYLQLCQDISHDLPRLRHSPSGAPGRVRLHYAVNGRLVPLIFDLKDQLVVTVLDDDGPPQDCKEPPIRKSPRKRKGNGRAQRHKWTRYDVD